MRKYKTALITGASGGLGLEFARILAQKKYDLVLVARNEGKLYALKNELETEYGISVYPYATDLSVVDAALNVFNYTLENDIEIDVLINNAGIMDDMGPVGDLTDEKFDQIIQVNLYGPMCAMRKAVNVFKEQGGGAIVNVASLGAIRTAAGAAYCASKAAIVSMTKNTAFMYQPDGIRCNAIAPGGIATEIGNSMGQPNMSGYGRVQKVLATAPEPGQAADIAKAALFLASDESSYISGDVLVVDGGWNAG